MPFGNHVTDDLIETAGLLLSVRSGRAALLKVYRRRAVSSAYYAVFQAVCYVFARETVGWGSSSELIDPVFRALEHERTQQRLSSARDIDLRRIGTILLRLREVRHSADYAPPSFDPPHADVVEFVEQAREARQIIGALTAEQSKLLVSLLISRSRR